MASPLGGPNIGIAGNGALAPRATAPPASAGVLGAPPTGTTAGVAATRSPGVSGVQPGGPSVTQPGGGTPSTPGVVGSAGGNGWNSVPGWTPPQPVGVNGAVVGAPAPSGLTPDQTAMYNSVGWYNPTPGQTFATFNAGADGQAMAAANGGQPLYNIGANGNVTVSNPGTNQVGGNMALTGGPGNAQNSGLLQFLQAWASMQNPTNPSAQITNSLDGSGTGSSTDLTTLLGLLGGYGSYNPYGLSNYTRQQLQWPTFA